MKRTLALLSLAAVSVAAHAQISLVNGSTYTQDFNTLPNVRTTQISSTGAAWVNGSTLTGWYAQAATAGAGGTNDRTNTTPADYIGIRINVGESNSGGIHSWGRTTSADGWSGTSYVTERALGMLGSGTPGTVTAGAHFRNTGTQKITELRVSFWMEQWRVVNAGSQTTPFSYSTDATTTTKLLGAGATWTNFTALDLVSVKINGPTSGTAIPPTSTTNVLDGNASANRVLVTGTISGLDLSQGQDIWFRWSDVDNTGSDHGMAIDDLSVQAVPEPATLAALGVGAAALIRRRRKN